MLIGFVAGACCYFAVALKPRLGYDDSLDVVGIHGLDGIMGLRLTDSAEIEEFELSEHSEIAYSN